MTFHECNKSGNPKPSDHFSVSGGALEPDLDRRKRTGKETLGSIAFPTRATDVLRDAVLHKRIGIASLKTWLSHRSVISCLQFTNR
jgi:hypothetical protein